MKIVESSQETIKQESIKAIGCGRNDKDKQKPHMKEGKSKSSQK
jgi:hypothetical protein